MPIRLQKIAVVLYELKCFLLCVEVVLVDVHEPGFFTCVSWPLICLDCTLIDDSAPSAKDVGNDFVVCIHCGDFLMVICILFYGRGICPCPNLILL